MRRTMLYVGKRLAYIGKYFKLKEKSIGPPDVYLGVRMRQVKLDNGSKAWAFSFSQYVVEDVKNVEA